MTLPVWDKTWTIVHWTAAASGFGDTYDDGTKMVAFKDALVATGFWSVAGSSNLLGFGMDSVDRWTSWSAIDDDCWIVLECSTIGSSGQFQMLIDFNNWYYSARADVSISASGVYDDSSASISTPPVADDEYYCANYFMGAWDDGGGERRFDLWYASDGTAFRAMAHGDLGVSNGDLWVFEEAGNVRDEWTNNFIFLYEEPTVAYWSAGTAAPYAVIDGVVTTVRMTAEGNNQGWIVEQDGFQYVDSNGEWWMQKALYFFCNSSRKYGICGKPIDWWFAPPTGVDTKTLFPSTGATTHITYENVVLPWDDSTPWG